MISRKSTFFLGIFVFLIPFFGFPSFWKMLFTIASGIILVAMSIKINIPNRKIIRNKIKKEKNEPVFINDIQVHSPTFNEAEPVPTPVVPPIEIPKPATRRRSAKSSANKIV